MIYIMIVSKRSTQIVDTGPMTSVMTSSS